jgi:hypothetical protein
MTAITINIPNHEISFFNHPTVMNTKPTKSALTKRAYARPAMRVYQLGEHPQLLAGSGQTTVAPTYNPFNEEKEW